ncbi:acyl-CoA dehydrogenase family protein [Saccharopolyspora griseoalba]|uniref:Acyl-CoA dehydrogenase family protein n=1 Tax=Saccharopolyspora griseoalba TaxID=1431848 RepID=A0ABW2LM90_9PSEU
MTAEPLALRSARELAEEVLFPASTAVDRSDRVPAEHLDLLAGRGLYGMAAPEESGLDLPDQAAALRLLEILAGGCLTTTFVWMQHHGAVRALAESRNRALQQDLRPELISGKRRAGVAISSAVRTGPAPLRAQQVVGGYLFSGTAPFVTGWGMIDLLHTAARDNDDALVFALLDAEENEGVTAEPLDLLAVRASGTVTLRFHRHFVPRDKIVRVVPQEEYLRGDAESLRFNGALSLGLAGRAISLLGEDAGGLPAELDAARDRLVDATAEEVPAARAIGSELAVRAANACAVQHGSGALLPGAHAQRLVREATFLLLFGSRPSVRAELLDRLTDR